ncbi:AAA family ATPase [Paenibacillus sp. P13VS]|uniref:AAA family ATPase n=1 Tax=Paenibacillus sp. P13VS TaxID=2697367 RepID=UPI00187B68D5|nr:AAA family ATPase [Paenibacillus sp. P13VS]MBE7684119.1 AAA family ATPase [Paenibacillus sp. P13VS]
MNDLFLKKISIQNFKLIDNFNLEIDLQDYNLIMLDGPNGFGKTTLFDAIELMLTGTIQRIRSDDGRSTFGVDLLRKNTKRDCIIKIEFGSNEKQFTLLKRLKANNKLHRFRTEDFFKFETFLLSSFDSPEEEYEEINQDRISELFNTTDLPRFYNLFYYIQQEENTHFLKRKSKERMEEVGQLFDTKQEEDTKRSLIKLKSKLRQVSTKVSKSLTEARNRYNYLINELQTFDKDSVRYTAFHPLLPHLEIPKPWDIELPIINTRESRDIILKELRLMYEFITMFQDFLNAKHNSQIDFAVSSDNNSIIRSAILTGLHINEFEEIKAIKQTEEKLNELLLKLSPETFLKNPSLLNFDILKEVNFPIDNYFGEINTLIIQITTDQKIAGNLSTLIKELNDSRNQLIEKFVKLTQSHTHIIDSICPLCGQNWEEQDILIRAIEDKKADFSKFYDVSTKRVEETTKQLYENFFQKIIDYVNDYLQNPTHRIDNKFFEEISNANKIKNRITKFVEWCQSKRIDVNKYFQKEREIPEDLVTRTDHVIQMISFERIHIDEIYDAGGSKFNEFLSIYKENFSESPERVRLVTQEQVQEKINYIEHIYFTGNTNELKKIEINISSLERKSSALEDKNNNLSDIIDEYDKGIKQHWNRIMKDIEIPFYIYSGKIIQYYQKGLGVFIKEAESGEAKNIKFVSDDMSEHDAINYFSSGQVSSLVISFTLALNKIYGNKGLGLILIDDPVQTMDELNMASLTELLRNEFPDKQIILSTHEDHISRYIRYKFQKYGKNTLQFNVKRELVNN